MKTLFVIPARGGSKGLPGKNKKHLLGKPLINYTIEIALQFSSPDHICVSTDDPEIKQLAEQAGVSVPFVRPEHLSSDTAGMNGVLTHALEFYEKKNGPYETLVLLQPTSPLRNAEDVRAALSLFNPKDDMVMSVHETKANPYFVLFEEDSGFLVKSKKGNFKTRQSAPKVYQANGAVYVINVNSLKTQEMSEFKKIRKFEMVEIRSVDIDTSLDFAYCEFLISKGYLNHS